MKKINYVFNQEGLTLDWMQEGSIVGYARAHVDPLVIPGPTSYSCAIEVYKDKTFEFKLLKAGEEPDKRLRKKIMGLSRYLHSLGYKGIWSRAGESSIKDIIIPQGYHENNE